MPSRFQLATSIVLAALTALVATAPAAWAQTPTTTVKDASGNAVFQSFAEGQLLAPGPFNAGATIPATGAGTRLMWWPEKAAFRAGRVFDDSDTFAGVDGRQFWNDTNVGAYSVALGQNTKASDEAATAMGSNTTASGPNATAIGFETTASGRQTTAMGQETTASGSNAAAMGFETTAATDQSLSIGTYNDANRDPDGDGTSDNTLFVAGNGSSSSRSDALVLKKDGDLAVGPSDPQDLRLFVQDEKDNAGVKDNPSANMALFENTSTGSKPDVMGLQAGPSSPGGGVAYLTFYDRTGTTVGQVEGNGSGGVNYSSASADFAEELPVVKSAAKPEAAELVGVRGGTVSLDTEGADRVMVVSTDPIMTGNTAPGTDTADADRVKVAFVGQVPTRVRGTVETGDLIVASGENDGTACAVSPSEYRKSEHGPIAGQAWAAKTSDGIGEVTVAVGLGRSGAVAERLQAQQKQIESMKQRLAALEAKVSTDEPAVAGLGGSSAGLLLAFLMGGLLGAGLLWRRREA